MDKFIRSSKELGAAICMARKAKNLRQVDVAQKASTSGRRSWNCRIISNWKSKLWWTDSN